MRNNRCWFRTHMNPKSVFGCKNMTIEVSDFFGCLKDSVQKPLSFNLVLDTDSFSMDTEIISEYQAKNTMNNFKQFILRQAEQFFEEFYHYNFEDMKAAIKECLDKKE